MNPDEFKKLIEEIGSLIDKRAETTETTIKAHISKEIEAAEERLTTKIETARAEARIDNLHVQGKLDKVLKRHEKRLDN